VAIQFLPTFGTIEKEKRIANFFRTPGKLDFAEKRDQEWQLYRDCPKATTIPESATSSQFLGPVLKLGDF
jgi:hypothetical protein